MNKDRFSKLELIAIWGMVDDRIKYIEENKLFLDKALLAIREKLIEEIKEHQS